MDNINSLVVLKDQEIPANEVDCNYWSIHRGLKLKYNDVQTYFLLVKVKYKETSGNNKKMSVLHRFDVHWKSNW